jgi:hypothetical protein
MRLLISNFLLAAAASCVLSIPTEPSARSLGRPDVLTVFLTGNELGALKPCGCSGGQLGGLDRRWQVLNSVPANKRVIVDTGSFVQTDGQQDLIKFDILMEAFNRLRYDAVRLTDKDMDMAANRGLFQGAGLTFSLMSAEAPQDSNLPSSFTKQLPLMGRTVAVTVASFDAISKPVEQVKELFAGPPAADRANILILNRWDKAAVSSISQMGIVDCLVCPSESDEPALSSDPNARPLVISVGQYGKYVAKLQISPVEGDDKLNLSFSYVPVTEDLKPDGSLVELYKAYQQFVRDARLLENHPRYPLPNGLEYTGSESCRPCHSYEYEKWSTQKHAHAYATLEREGSQYDPECIVCHVVGLEYETGFISEQQTPHLKNVGCENCHGPGSKHIKNPLQEKTTLPMSDCTDCHTPEHSGGFAGHEHEYFEKIVHKWKEPNAPGNVK